MGAREEQLRTLHRELQTSEENRAAMQQTIQQRDREVSELRQILVSANKHLQMVRMHHIAPQDKRQVPTRPVTVGRWQSLINAPASMNCGSSAVIGFTTYFKSIDTDDNVYEFNNNQWNKLPSLPSKYCTMVIVCVNDMLTTVGGWSQSSSNELYSYIDNQWVKHFPPMLTKRWYPAAVYVNKTLLVAGGRLLSQSLTTVEILNTINRQWSSVSPLPVGMNSPSVTIRGDYLYIHPHSTKQEKKNSVYKCSLEQLVQSQSSSAIWEKITSLPVSFSSLVTVNSQLLAVGGYEATKNIYQYIRTSWVVVGYMTSPRTSPITAVLPGYQLMVVSGNSKGESKKCELTTVI